jgi:hypothetical protein
MKNNFLKMAFVSLFTVVALCSCDKDDDGDNVPTSVVADNTITATVENGNDKIAVVKAIMFYDGYIKEAEIATALYSDGGFTLKLPETVNDAYLNAIEDEGYPAEIKISNPEVKTNGVIIYAHNAAGKSIGYFHYRDDSGLTGSPIYSTGDVSITGSGIDEDGEVSNYNIHLKTGWNIEFNKRNESTTQTPSGTMKWYFVEIEEEEEEIPTNALITATVENGSSYNDKIAVVKATIYYDDDDKEKEIASAPYGNGGFTLNFPETLDDKYLGNIEDDFLDGVTISDPNVKITFVYTIDAYMQDENVGFFYAVGVFYYESSDGWETQYLYSNGNVSITGVETDEYKYDYNRDGDYDDEYDVAYKDTYKYNVHLKKGWNILYGKETEKGNNEYDITTQAPSGTMKWYFEANEFYTPESSVSKKIHPLLTKRKARL